MQPQVPTAANADLYAKYQALAGETENVQFLGRLATYRYYNMDQVVAQALATARRLLQPEEPLTAPGAAAT